MERFIPRKGQVFDSRDALEERLLESGWDFEGHGTALDEGRAIGYDIGVTDEKNDVWIMIEMVPLGVKVTKVKRLKLSDYSSPRKTFKGGGLKTDVGRGIMGPTRGMTVTGLPSGSERSSSFRRLSRKPRIRATNKGNLAIALRM